MRVFIDILIAMVLVAVLFFCGGLAWNAYIHHRNTLLLNSKVLDEIKNDINDQTKGASPDIKTKINQEIARIQLAQEKLFDANSVSFIFQFVTLIILTIGISILTLMYSQYRREQNRADKSEKSRSELFSALAPFAAGQNTCVVVASKYHLVYTLCRLYTLTNSSERNSSLIMMVDYQNDILRHLESALREKEGLEPLWHEVILDLADQLKRRLLDIKITVTESEKDSLDRLLSICSQCHEILWNNGEEFANRYNDYLKKMTGLKPPTTNTL